MNPVAQLNILTLPIIGYLRSPLIEKFGTPRQPNLVDVVAHIELCAPYDDLRAFDGIERFSHVWLLWQFHHNRDNQFRPQIRPPRLGGNTKVGVFASRSMYRPAPIGLSVVRRGQLQQINGQLHLEVIGADLIDGTPIIDIKPYLAYADAHPDAVSGFAPDAPTALAVQWTDHAQQAWIHQCQRGQLQQSDQRAIEQLLALDPRPAYQQDERLYGMAYASVNVRFVVRPDGIEIQDIQPR
ncbi:MAG: tRNA (N6-threonylcarbamoyladenosine(37)-N6)-methyltransferase TrmO [Pseudomonadota bacterium]|nr:tRNA (N6-threonylcarbamoyladenosine(37)-N6)-methyltransferase TrmO [Pseudomonadota bacterium]